VQAGTIFDPLVDGCDLYGFRLDPDWLGRWRSLDIGKGASTAASLEMLWAAWQIKER
jgi:hypothetical protein